MGGAGQPVRGVVGGAVFHLAQRAVLAVRVEEAGVPPVRQQGVLPGLRVGGEARPAAAVLIDAQVRHRCRVLVRQRIGPRRERLVGGWPGDPGVPGSLRWVIPRSVTGRSFIPNSADAVSPDTMPAAS